MSNTRHRLLPMLAALVVVPGWAQTALAATQHLRIRSDAPAAPTDGSEAGRRTTTVPSALDPQITITANRDTIFSTLEDLRLLLKRSESGNRLSVKVKLEQDRDWLTDRSHDVTIRAGDTVADLTIPRGDFKSDIARSGDLTATVDPVSGYNTGDAKATVYVISQADPVVTFSLSEESYTYAEDVGRARAQFVARMAPGMPRAVTVAVLIGTSGKDLSAAELTATSGEDFEPVSGGLQMVEGKYEIENGRWVGRTDVTLPFLDDDVREGTEMFELALAPVPELSHTDAAQLLNPDGTACEDVCRHLIHITDEEDIPEMELSVNPEEITEEDEASATATLSITDDKSFATDQLVTLALGGTATKGADYVVTPADADQDAEDYQVILPVESRSVEVTLKAMSDDVDDPDEKIEVSALLEGSEVDDMQAVQIMQQQQEMPKITVAASRDTIIAGPEDLIMTLKREAPLDDALTVTVQLTQEQSWLSDTSYDVTFAASDAVAFLVFPAGNFSSSVVQSGNLTVAVDSVDGYDTGEATATVFVVSQDGPAVTVSLTHSSYLFEEDADSTYLIVTARMAAGMPRGASVEVSLFSEGRADSRPELTAVLGEDYSGLSVMPSPEEEDYALENGRWVGRDSVAVTLLDDDVREGRESFQMHLHHAPGSFREEIQLLNPDTTACSGDDECRYPVFIDDDEDIPTLDLSVSADEISEEDEASSTATVSITNGKTFAADQTVTFSFGGTATEGTDYTVAPADHDDEASGHQVVMPEDSTSVEVTLTAADDDVIELNETIEVSATHEGDTIGSARTISILSEAMPKITVAASSDTVIAGLEPLSITLTREAPLDDALTVTLQLTQEQSWLSDTSYDLTFRAGDAETGLALATNDLSTSVVESGDLTASVASVDGYDTGEATATVLVISQDGPAVSVSLSQSSYLFEEDADSTDLIVTARMAAGMPRGASVVVSVSTEGRSSSRPELTAVSGVDFSQDTVMPSLPEEDYALENGRWVARDTVPVTLLDDDVREGRERFRVRLQHAAGRRTVEIQLLNPDTTACTGDDDCLYSVFIDDDEDIPGWDLSVNEAEIREEGETSSTATLSITNGKTFAADQVVTFTFAGTATEDDDYLVTPADADGETAGHQVNLSAGSTSLGITLTAVDDDVEDSNETIEVSATLGGDTIGSTQTIRILNQEVLPKITLAASRDTIIAGLETLVLTATREAPLDAPVAVTLLLTQEQDWLSRTSHQLNFAAQGSVANLNLSRALFSSGVTQSGALTAILGFVSGYDTGDAAATVHVVSQAGPAIKVSFAEESYRFAEDESDPSVTFVARAAAGMPRGATFTFSVSARSGTAASPGDYEAVSEPITVQEDDFTLEGGVWEARHELPLTLVDDDAFEGTESFDMLLEMLPGHPSEVQLSDLQGEACRDGCATPVEITDDEDIPIFALSVSDEEIMEEGETSSIATVSITNGKTFAADQMVTFELDGKAIPDHDYNVTPADADQQAEGHQVTLPADSSSVDATFTAVDDEREEGDEEIRISVTHDGSEIGSGTIRIIDRFPGPRVEVTFEGVEPPNDDYTAGIATGPFTTRFTFSEPVDGFTEEDIDWQTQAGTTEDSTSIGVILWDFTEVRAGLEYTVEMMPTQKGRLWILVFPGKTTSVGTGDENQLGANSLWVRFPPDRLLVAPAELTVDEGDAEGAFFLVVLTSAPTDTVKVTVSGIAGTEVEVDPDTLTVVPRFWRVGRGMDVTAGSDANTSDETVSLTVRAWGGGYEGRSARVVVRVKDSGGGHDQGMSEDDALTLVDDVTPEAAAAALFGEGDLSAAQLDALDLLGNRNGEYDLGDLMSWMERCRRGGASCGSSLSPDFESVPGAAAGMLGLAAAGGSGRTGGRRRRGSGKTSGSVRSRRVRRRPGRAWFDLTPLLAAAMIWGCADDVMQTTVAEADPGYLTVQLTAPAGARDMAAMLLVEGPGIDSVRAPGFELFQSDPSSHARRQVIVSGALSTGPILEFQVPDRGDLARYTVRLRQVAGEDYTLRDLSRYTVVISR